MRRDRAAREHVKSPAGLRGAAPVFAALGDATRLTLVQRLSASGPVPQSNLGDGVGMSRQAVAKHLRVLERAGLARSRRRGRVTFWELRRPRMDEAQRALASISQQWDEALHRLRDWVEG